MSFNRLSTFFKLTIDDNEKSLVSAYDGTTQNLENLSQNRLKSKSERNALFPLNNAKLAGIASSTNTYITYTTGTRKLAYM